MWHEHSEILTRLARAFVLEGSKHFQNYSFFGAIWTHHLFKYQ